MSKNTAIKGYSSEQVAYLKDFMPAEEALIPSAKEIQEWPEPEPIIASTLPSVEKLPVSYIPDPLQDWLTDISYRMQCPLDFVAVGAIVAAASVIGTGCGIRPKQHDDWTVIPNLWGGVVARPSMLKTPALKEALRPLEKLEDAAREQFEEDMRFAEAEEAVFKAKKDSLKKQMAAAAKGGKNITKTLNELKYEYIALQEPKPPARRRYKTNDATIEKLSEILNENRRGILIFRDELIGLLVSWDKPGRESDRAFFLEAWNGLGSFSTDRISRGTIDTQNLCISILGGIQPGKLTAYLAQANNPLGNDGLIQRFQLLVYPDEPAWQLVDKPPNLTARKKAYKVFENLSEMDFTKYGATADEKIPYFRFSDEAQDVFNIWLFDLQLNKLKNEPPLMVEHMAKYRSLMPSLALVFHLIEVAGGAPGGPVPKEAALRSYCWCEYLESHAKRIYGLAADTAEQAAVSLAKKIKDGALDDGFSLRDIYRKCWSNLTTKQAAQTACNVLVEANWLRENTEGRKKRTLYYINPLVFNSSTGKSPS